MLNGPYSITRNGFSGPVTYPQFRSLFIRVTVTDQKSISVSFPTISSTEMDGTVALDIPQ